ncbi:MAG: hypothetical protein JSV78_11475 [Phycisphaerales bacterium]|nr:MAG: hypothetical protein JSV78_11475 [Phycisphaerales bacterium]
MGFASGSVTFRRYYLCGEHPSSLTKEWLSSIAGHAFGKQREATSDGIETGWIGPTHLFNVEFSTPQHVAVGRFIYLGFRMDRTAAPSAIVRSYQRMEEEAALEASGQPYITRAEKRMAREAAMAKAEREARAGAFRRVSAYPLAIDLEDGVAYFGNLGATASDKMMSLFSDTFDVALVPATPEEVAVRTAQRLRVTQALEDVRPLYLVDPPPGTDGRGDGAWPEMDRTFLGREFLLWLWFRCHAEEGVLDLGRGRNATIAINKVMRLECPWQVTGTDTIMTDAPGIAPEARAALRLGKQPTKMGLLIGAGVDDYRLVLDGPKLAVNTLVFSAGDQDGHDGGIEHRLASVRKLASMLDNMYKIFLKCRLSSVGKDEQVAMRKWARAAATPRVATAQRATA